MNLRSNQLRAGVLAAAVMFAMAVALDDKSVAFALGVAAFVGFGGLSGGRRCGGSED